MVGRQGWARCGLESRRCPRERDTGWAVGWALHLERDRGMAQRSNLTLVFRDPVCAVWICLCPGSHPAASGPDLCVTSAGRPEWEYIVPGASGRTHPQGLGRIPRRPWRSILVGEG